MQYLSTTVTLTTGSHCYIYRDKISKREKGFALLTRARIEGEKYELREVVGAIHIQNVIERINLKASQEQANSTKNDVLSASKDSEALTSNIKDEVDEVKLTAHQKHAVYEQSSTTKGIVINTFEDISPMEMMTAEMTREELLEELLFNFDASKCSDTYLAKARPSVSHRSKIRKKGPVPSLRKKNKRKCLKLPSGWDKLMLWDLVEKIKSFNKINASSPDERLERILETILKGSQIKNNEEENSTNLDPVKLPLDWKYCSSSDLVAYLKPQCDMYGKPLTKLCEKLMGEGNEKEGTVKFLDKTSPYGTNLVPVKLPSDWKYCSSADLVAHLRPQLDLTGKPLTELCEKLEKNSGPSSSSSAMTKQGIGKTSWRNPVKLPSNWEYCSSGDLADYLRPQYNMAGKPLTELCEKLEKEDNHIELETSFSSNMVNKLGILSKITNISGNQSSIYPVLEDVVEKVKSKKVTRNLPVVLSADWEQRRRGSEQLLGQSKERVVLPYDWESYVSVGKLVDKIEEMNPGKDVSRVAESMRKREKHIRESIVNAGDGDDNNRVMLPSNWGELRDNGTLIEKIQEVNPGKDVAQLVEKMSQLKEQKSSRHMVAKVNNEDLRSKTNCVLLPPDWEELRDHGSLIEKIQEVNPGKDVAPLVKKMRQLKEQRSSRHMVVKVNSDELSSQTSRVILPPDWEELRDHGSLLEKIQEVNPDKDVAPLVEKMSQLKEQRSAHHLVARVTNNELRSQTSRVILPSDWEELRDHDSLIEKIFEVNPGKDVAPLVKKMSQLKEQRSSHHIAAKDNNNELRSQTSRVILPPDWEELRDHGSLLEKIQEANPGKDVAPLVEKMSQLKEVNNNELRSQTSRVILPPDWEELRDQVSLLEKIQQLNSDKDVSAVVDKLRRKQKIVQKGHTSLSLAGKNQQFVLPDNWDQISRKELADKIRTNFSKSNSSKNFTELFAKLENKKVGHVPKNVKSVGLPQDWENFIGTDHLVEMLKAANPDKEISGRLLDNLARERLNSTEKPKPKKRVKDRHRERKRHKKSTTVLNRLDRKSSGLKLPPDWMNLSRDELAEKLRNEGIVSEDVQTLLANLKKTKSIMGKDLKIASDKKSVKSRPSKSFGSYRKSLILPRDWDKFSNDALADKLLADNSGNTDNESSRAFNEVIKTLKSRRLVTENTRMKRKRVVHQKKTKHVHKTLRKEKKVSMKYNPTYSIYSNLSEEEKSKLLEPNKYRWRRECSVGLTSARIDPESFKVINDKIRIDIYYWPPSPFSRLDDLPAHCGKELQKCGARRIRSLEGLKAYLKENKSEKSGLTMENFSFRRKILNLGELEYVRYTDEAKEHLSRRQKALSVEDESLDCLDDGVARTAKAIFGDISDLDHDDDHKERLTGLEDIVVRKSTGIFQYTPREAVGNTGSNDKNVDKTRNVDTVSNGKEKDGLKEHACALNVEESHVKMPVKKLKERKQLTIYSSQQAHQKLGVSVKQDRPVKKALLMFCSKYLLEMSSLEFWCGETKLCGEEKIRNLEESNIRVAQIEAAIQYEEPFIEMEIIK